MSLSSANGFILTIATPNKHVVKRLNFWMINMDVASKNELTLGTYLFEATLDLILKCVNMT